MLNASDHLKIATIFLSTHTFRWWQKYCRLRDQFIPIVGGKQKFYTHKLSEGNIRKYILPSLTFKLWLPLYHLRQSIQKLLPRSFKKQVKLFSSFFHVQKADIDPRVMREWKRWNNIRLENL